MNELFQIIAQLMRVCLSRIGRNEDSLLNYVILVGLS